MCPKQLTKVSVIKIPSRIPLGELVMFKLTRVKDKKIKKSFIVFHDVLERVRNKHLHLILVLISEETVQVCLLNLNYTFVLVKIQR